MISKLIFIFFSILNIYVVVRNTKYLGSEQELSYLKEAHILNTETLENNNKFFDIFEIFTIFGMFVFTGLNASINYNSLTDTDIMYTIFSFIVGALFLILNGYMYTKTRVNKVRLLKLAQNKSETLNSVNEIKLYAYLLNINWYHSSNPYLKKTSGVLSAFISIFDLFEDEKDCKEQDKIDVESPIINNVLLENSVLLTTVITILKDKNLYLALETNLGRERNSYLISELNKIHDQLKKTIDMTLKVDNNLWVLDSLQTIDSMTEFSKQVK